MPDPKQGQGRGREDSVFTLPRAPSGASAQTGAGADCTERGYCGFPSQVDAS